MNKTIFKGTCTAAITPFTEDGIDFNALGKQIDFQIENGIDALCILGTTGEAPTITDSEYEAIAKFSYDKIAGRVKFILGSGSNCTKKAIEKSQLAQKIGADGLLVVTPYYNKCTQKGIVKYYNDIGDNVDIPILCYNVPARTGVNILPRTMEEIAQHKNIGGIKEACGNMEQICETARLIRGKTALYSGDDNLNLAMLSIGSLGLISVASNIAPKEVGDVARLYYAGKNKEATELQERLLPLIDAMFTEVNPIPVKKAAELLGMGSGIVRAPLTELEPQHTLSLIKILKDFGLKVKE
ncbi:MAG: 4-hydroxy-tetrahydrodipicolinate synthase [Clostridiales bacterium]|nr:4-hydroxy-tetrahydrodipicolinate synthase [Clostridiales bacterium]